MHGESNNAYNRYASMMLMLHHDYTKHDIVAQWPKVWALNAEGKLYQCHDGNTRMVVEENI